MFEIRHVYLTFFSKLIHCKIIKFVEPKYSFSIIFEMLEIFRECGSTASLEGSIQNSLINCLVGVSGAK